MSELKTKENTASVEAFLNNLSDKTRKQDSYAILDIVSKFTTEPAVMWGTAIIGFGHHTYLNGSGKEQTWFQFGFSPRKNALTLYVAAYDNTIYQIAESIGLKHGKGCVYVKDLSKVPINPIIEMIRYTFEKNS